MLAYAMVRYLPNAGSIERGDIICIIPVKKIGNKNFDNAMIFAVDLNIPCGDKFSYIDGEKQFSCPKCRWNDPEICDVQRLQRPLFSVDLFDNPKMVAWRGYKIDIDAHIDEEAKIEIEENTTVLSTVICDKLVLQADNNPITRATVIEKVVK